jgi:membrane-bound ClpP family serine protease
MEPLVGGSDRRDSDVLSVCRRQRTRAQRLLVKCRQRNVNAFCPIDASGEKVFGEGEYWSATSDTFVKEGESVQIIAVEGLTTKVKLET